MPASAVVWNAAPTWCLCSCNPLNLILSPVGTSAENPRWLREWAPLKTANVFWVWLQGRRTTKCIITMPETEGKQPGSRETMYQTKFLFGRIHFHLVGTVKRDLGLYWRWEILSSYLYQIPFILSHTRESTQTRTHNHTHNQSVWGESGASGQVIIVSNRVAECFHIQHLGEARGSTEFRSHTDTLQLCCHASPEMCFFNSD